MIRLVLFSFFGLLLFASCQEVRKTEAIEKIDSHYASENLVHFTRTSSAMNRIEAYGILGNGKDYSGLFCAIHLLSFA